MTGFFSKIFGGSKETQAKAGCVELVKSTIETVIEKAGLELTCEVSMPSENKVHVDVTGNDEPLLLDKNAQLLDGLQLYLLRVLQHNFKDERIDLTIDSSEYRKETNKALEELAEELRDKVLSNNKSVYYRALPPRDRKVIHQYLANDGRVKSRSVGEGLYKRIKVYPVRQAEVEN